MKPFEDKIIPYESLEKWRVNPIFRLGIGCTNGVFDFIHVGHIELFYRIKLEITNFPLLVLVNSDESVRQIKGKDRPITNENDRAIQLAALSMVDFVCIFPEPSAENALRKAAPRYFFKMLEFEKNKQKYQNEIAAVEENKGEVIILPQKKIRNSSEIIEKIKNL